MHVLNPYNSKAFLRYTPDWGTANTLLRICFILQTKLARNHVLQCTQLWVPWLGLSSIPPMRNTSEQTHTS